MNKADNDASTRAIDSLINYEVRTSVIDANIWIYLCCLVLFSFGCFCHWCEVDFFFFNVLQTVKYFNNEGYEADKYDEYLKSKSFSFYGKIGFEFLSNLLSLIA